MAVAKPSRRINNGEDILMSVVNFGFSGTVTAVSDPTSGIVVGDTITGTVSYDSTQTGSAGLYNFTSSSKVHLWTLKAFHLGVQVKSDSFAGGTHSYMIQIVYNVNVGGVMGTTMEVKGPGTSQQTNLDLAMFDAGNTGQTSADALPTSTDIANFATSSVGV